ncbi:MAG: flagellar motor switch protein FliM [Lachnospiraceae bacterium]|nr:flagellar motor switch protein FliM [Lachnospiraceae bacterium]
MGEVLSQSEIDNLLAALSTGELDVEAIQEPTTRQAKDYDFKRPAKFSKEHLRTLEIIYEHYGRLISTNLPVYLRKNIQVSVVSSETVTFSEFTNALSNPVILCIINFQPLVGNIIVELAANLGYAMLDRMLGGQGLPLEKPRDFSEIEMTIIEKLMIICMQLMRDPWKNVVDVNPIMERIETNPQFVQVISPNDMIAIVTMNIKIGDVESLMNICLPFFTLETVMDRLNTKFWFSAMKEEYEEDFAEHVNALLKRVDVPIKAVLGRSSVKVNDFISLQAGDIIRLDSRVDSEMRVYVGNIEKFAALPGANRNNYAVRVTQVIREENTV